MDSIARRPLVPNRRENGIGITRSTVPLFPVRNQLTSAPAQKLVQQMSRPGTPASRVVAVRSGRGRSQALESKVRFADNTLSSNWISFG